MTLQLRKSEYDYIESVRITIGAKNLSQTIKMCLEDKKLFKHFCVTYAADENSGWSSVGVYSLTDETEHILIQLSSTHLHSLPVIARMVLFNPTMQAHYKKINGWAL